MNEKILGFLLLSPFIAVWMVRLGWDTEDMPRGAVLTALVICLMAVIGLFLLVIYL